MTADSNPILDRLPFQVDIPSGVMGRFYDYPAASAFAESLLVNGLPVTISIQDSSILSRTAVDVARTYIDGLGRA
ncbi:hypothetical protein EDF22_0606 [Rathayibacter sp. PhB127]|uniref:hypothetical protein n=1 Tax=Rathayibacter sp. PhB127 TaxID=2485176 RepID=UPI000F4CD4C3|nr:hypothetical protein [Rathayibacter sp. PhB127]ROS28875.1 hypothetical protein EDF22_0606 [Rathayibacter sp. PhB127]